jgi:hypothetical protein
MLTEIGRTLYALFPALVVLAIVLLFIARSPR